MATKTTKPKHIKLLEAFVKGKNLTLRQIGEKFDAANPSDLVYKVRKLDVHVRTRKNKKGINEYGIDIS